MLLERENSFQLIPSGWTNRRREQNQRRKRYETDGKKADGTGHEPGLLLAVLLPGTAKAEKRTANGARQGWI